MTDSIGLKKIYIFGAHSRAQTLAYYLKTIYKELVISAYLVDNDEANMTTIDGIDVLNLSDTPNLDIECPVYIATRGVYHKEIIDRLSKIGFKEIKPVTPDLDTKLRNQFLTLYYDRQGRSFNKIKSCSSAHSIETNTPVNIYVVKSIYDSVLKNNYIQKDYYRDIQVGAALTDKKVANIDFFDNDGVSISEYNKQFCELTALYWIWKNHTDTNSIVGLEHYRRHFILPEDWINISEEERIDVILPTPLYVHPNLRLNYIMRHDESDWNNMMTVLGENYPDMYCEAKEYFEQGLYSPCNMIIARKKIFDEMCEFIFEIVLECQNLGGIKQDTYQNRYPGFLSERLMSFFFEYNRNRFNIVYADKNFLE